MHTENTFVVCIQKDAHWKFCSVSPKRCTLKNFVVCIRKDAHYKIFQCASFWIHTTKFCQCASFWIHTTKVFSVCIFLDTHCKFSQCASFRIHTTKIFSVCIFLDTHYKIVQCASFWRHTTKFSVCIFLDTHTGNFVVCFQKDAHWKIFCSDVKIFSWLEFAPVSFFNGIFATNESFIKFLDHQIHWAKSSYWSLFM